MALGLLKLSILTHACNLSIREAEGGPWDQGQP